MFENILYLVYQKSSSMSIGKIEKISIFIFEKSSKKRLKSRFVADILKIILISKLYCFFDRKLCQR